MSWVKTFGANARKYTCLLLQNFSGIMEFLNDFAEQNLKYQQLDF